MNPFADQARFMSAAHQSTDRYNSEQAWLYFNLIREEFAELQDATSDVERADAIFDLIVVCIGYALSMGWPIEDIWAEGHRSNMAKIDPDTGHVIRHPTTGKVLKPASWSPPNFAPLLP